MTTAVPQRTKAPSRFHPGVFALRDTWFPLVHTQRVGRRPLRRAMHGAPVILWRDGARLRATEDLPGTPPQRRRQGELTGGTGDYITADRYGYTWVWYGDPLNASPDLIPQVPHLPLEGMPKRFQKSVLFDCTYELVAENLLDLTHADFLHSKLTGDSLSEDDIVEVESTSEIVTMIRTARGRPIPDVAEGDGARERRHRTSAWSRSPMCAVESAFCTVTSTRGCRSGCCTRAIPRPPHAPAPR